MSGYTTIPAGREMDALVAERAMGARVSTWSLHLAEAEPQGEYGVAWKHGLFSLRGFPAEVLLADANGDMPATLMLPRDADADDWRGIPHYSTDIAAAWAVVLRLKDRHGFTLHGGPDDEGVTDFVCVVKAFGYRPFQDKRWERRAETAALAICRAALAAVEAR